MCFSNQNDGTTTNKVAQLFPVCSLVAARNAINTESSRSRVTTAEVDQSSSATTKSAQSAAAATTTKSDQSSAGSAKSDQSLAVITKSDQSPAATTKLAQSPAATTKSDQSPEFTAGSDKPPAATAEADQSPTIKTESDQSPLVTINSDCSKTATTGTSKKQNIKIIANYDDVPKEFLELTKNSKLITNTSHYVDESSLVLDGLKDDQWMKISESHLSVYTVAQYPENHNPMLSLTLQQELDQKTPKEFLIYVHTELTLDERESLLVDEGQRRKTFQTNWPHEGHLSGTKMAQAGLYYLGDTDHVQCVFCRGRLHKWSDSDNPMTEHARLFNFCRFVKGLECGNREYRSKKLTKEETQNITTFGSPTVAEQRRNQDGGADCGPLGVCTNRAAVIRYAPDSARLRTYARWPTSSPIAAEQLCDAGFYYTGFDDQVRCFFCSGSIKGWTGNDIPWEEHARWFPDCSYLLNKKGRDYVDEVHERTPDNKKTVRKTKKQQTVKDKKQTIISKQEEMERLCERLGHSSQTIERALDINGGPFESVKDMIEMLHLLENGTEPPTAKAPSFPYSRPTQELEQPPPQQTENQPGQMAEVDRSTKHTASCRTCELKTTNFVPANHIGLPCGHLIYCESCKGEEFKKSQTQPVKCPFFNCSAPLAGVCKVYFA